jgi:hypothetical protein
MCTVSVVTHASGARLVCNRDERRTRPQAVAPGEHRLDRVRALFPVDPRGRGTWVGVNDHGLVAALLNRTSTDGPDALCDGPVTTRGVIVPQLLAATTIDEAVAHAVDLPRRSFAPFRLVLLQDADLWVVTGGGGSRPRVEARLSATPAVFASSSLGDALVEGPRRQLFEELLARNPARPLIAQAAFHAHRWRQRPELSVVMTRDDACTVSRTKIDVDYVSKRVGLRYEAIEDPAAWSLAC